MEVNVFESRAALETLMNTLDKNGFLEKYGDAELPKFCDIVEAEELLGSTHRG